MNREFARRGLWLIAAVAFPALLVQWLVYLLDLVAGWFNVDYWLALALAALGRRKLALTVLVIAALADAFRLFVQVYPVVGFSDLLYLLSLWPMAALPTQLAALGALSALIVVVWGVAAIGRHVQPLVAIGLLYVGLLGAWFGGGFTNDVDLRYWLAQRHVIESGITKLLNAQLANPLLQDLAQPAENHLGAPGMSSFMQTVVAADDPSQKILLVVAESWGVAKNAALQQKILEPLRLLNGSRLSGWRYDELSVGGGTLQGEIRELCNTYLAGINLREVAAGFDVCWPQRLTAAGYHTISVHAAPSAMYHRRELYPRLGFAERIFLENGQFLSRCFSFPGACDSEVLERHILPALKAEKVFAYWLTLNTHFAYDRRDLQQEYFHCAEFGLQQGEMSCRMFQLHAQFFAELAAQIAVGNISGVAVVIVGDHAPPLQSEDVYAGRVGALYFEVVEQ